MPTVYLDAEFALIGYLTPILSTVVATRVPDPRPETWVQVRRSGGTSTSVRGSSGQMLRDHPLMDVFASAATEPDAMALAFAARSAIWDLEGTNLLGSMCYRVSEFLGPRRADDVTQAMPVTPRVWATYELSIRTS